MCKLALRLVFFFFRYSVIYKFKLFVIMKGPDSSTGDTE